MFISIPTTQLRILKNSFEGYNATIIQSHLDLSLFWGIVKQFVDKLQALKYVFERHKSKTEPQITN